VLFCRISRVAFGEFIGFVLVKYFKIKVLGRRACVFYFEPEVKKPILCLSGSRDDKAPGNSFGVVEIERFALFPVDRGVKILHHELFTRHLQRFGRLAT